MTRREKAHKMLDALLDRLEELDARNSDEGRRAAMGELATMIPDLLVGAGLDAPVKHLFNAEAAEALGAPPEELDARGLTDWKELDVRAGDDHVRAQQLALAMVLYRVFAPLTPPTVKDTVVPALLEMAGGGASGVLRPVGKGNRKVKEPLAEKAVRRGMVLKAAYEAAREEKTFDDVLAKGAGLSADTVDLWPKEVDAADREAARRLGRAEREGEQPDEEAEAIREHIRAESWEELREARRAAMAGTFTGGW